MSGVVDQLAGGDLRSIGASNNVVAQVLARPELLQELIAGLGHPDRVVRSRCADAAEKVSARHPDWLQPHAKTLITLMKSAKEPELRWHLAQMLPRLDLDRRRRQAVITAMYSFLDDDSRIVATFALQALFDLSKNDAALRQRLLPKLEECARTGRPAMRARARRLMRQLS